MRVGGKKCILIGNPVSEVGGGVMDKYKVWKKTEKEQRECEAREYGKPRERQRNAWTCAHVIGNSNLLDTYCHRTSLWGLPDHLGTVVLFHHINETPTQLSARDKQTHNTWEEPSIKLHPFTTELTGHEANCVFWKTALLHHAVWHSPVIPVTAGRHCHMSGGGQRSPG